DLTLQAGALSNQGGAIQSQGALNATLGSYGSDTGALLTSDQFLSLQASGLLQNEGLIGGVTGARITANSLTNQRVAPSLSTQNDASGQGTIEVDQGTLAITTAGNLSNSGTIISVAKDAVLTVGSLGNTGLITAQTGLQIQTTDRQTASTNHGELSTVLGHEVIESVADFDNRQGRILNAGGDLTLQVGSFDNSSGIVQSAGALGATSSDYHSDINSSLTSGQSLSFTVTGDLDNQNVIGGTAGTTVQAGSLNNGVRGQILATSGDIGLMAESLSNQGTIRTEQGLVNATITGNVSNSAGAVLVAASKTVTLHAGSLTNVGTIAANTGFDVTVQGGSANNGVISTISGDANLAVMGDLDNSHGKILNAGGGLTLQAGALSNQGGTIQSAGALTAVMGSYLSDNSSYLSSERALKITASGDIDNHNVIGGGTAVSLTAGSLHNEADATLVAVTGTMDLTTTGALVNNGLVRQQDDQAVLTLQAGSVENNADFLSQGVQHDIIHGDLVNHGQLRSENTLFVQADGSAANDALIFSKGSMQLGSHGAFINKGDHAQIGTQAGDVALQVASLDNGQGRIIAKSGALTVQSQQTIANDNGVLQGDGTVTVGSTVLENQQGLILSTASDISLTAGTVDNQNGNLRAAGGTTLQIGDYHSDQHSALTAGKNLFVTSSGTVDNEGTMGGIDGTNLHAANMLNGGQILSTQGDVSLATTIPEGTITNNGTIETLAGGHGLAITSGVLSNNGSVLSSGVLTALIGHDVSNNNVLYGANGLTVQVGGTLRNAGQISNDRGALTLSGDEIDNHQGHIFASGSGVDLQGNAIINDNGVIQSSDRVNVKGGQLSNQAGGIILADGSVQLEGTEEGAGLSVLDNQGGIVQAGRDLAVRSALLNNRNGQLLGVSGNVILNSGNANWSSAQIFNEGGSIKAGQNATILTGSWQDDASSVVDAVQTLALQASGDVHNHGTLIGGQGLILQAASVENDQASGSQGGVMASQGGTLRLIVTGGSGLVNNGRIEALNQSMTQSGDASLDIETASGVMNGGTILSQGDVTLKAGQDVTNGGKIGALGGDLALTASSLTNNGTLASSGEATIALGNGLTNNSQIYSDRGLTLTAGAIANHGGRIETQGLLSLTGTGLDNGNGTIMSGQNGVTGVINGDLSNQGGLIQGSLNAVLSGNTITNSAGGKILSKNGSLVLTASSLDNKGGVLQSGADTVLHSVSFDNSAGGLVNAVEGSVLVSANDNHASALVNNDHGTIQAQNDLKLLTQSLDNNNGRLLQQGGDGGLTVTGENGSALDLQEEGGMMQAGGDMTLSLHNLGNMTDLIAGRDLNIALESGIDGNVLFQSGRNMTLVAGGAYHVVEGAGVLAGGNATIRAASLDNEGALMANGGTLSVQSGGDITNHGLITGQTGVILALPGTLTNESAVIEAQNGSLQITGLNGGNAGDVINKGGDIAAGGINGDLTINAASVTNSYSGTVASSTSDHITIESTGGHTHSHDYNVPEGLLDKNGVQGTGYIHMEPDSGKGDKSSRGKSELFKIETTYSLNGTSGLITAGRDLAVTVQNGVTNDSSHLAAGRNIIIKGSDLTNIGHDNETKFYLYCNDHRGCDWDSSHSSVPFTDAAGNLITESGDAKKGHRADALQWGPTAHTASNATGTIIAGGDLVGNFTGDINNITQTAHAAPGSHISYTGPGHNGLTAAETAQSSAGQVATGTTDISLPGYEGGGMPAVTASQAVQKQSFGLPGFNHTALAQQGGVSGVQQGAQPDRIQLSGQIASAGLGGASELPGQAGISHNGGHHSTLPTESAGSGAQPPSDHLSGSVAPVTGGNAASLPGMSGGGGAQPPSDHLSGSVAPVAGGNAASLPGMSGSGGAQPPSDHLSGSVTPVTGGNAASLPGMSGGGGAQPPSDHL
ncbi:hypothetical protein PT283_08075, partial [Acetobacteraceae bacterium ESL0697]|nr:hypothetical protein [Acetobacteraceae bacterium ESL0697]